MGKYSSMSDNHLAAEYAREAGREVLAEIYDRFSHLVLGLCLKYLRNSQDAEDAVSGIFAGLITDLQKHQVSHLKSWLYVYSRNHCLMELRRRSSRLKKELDLREASVVYMESDTLTHLKEKDEEEGALREAIGTLSEAQEKCIRLFYLENCSYAQISRSTGYSANEVKSHIQNGKRNLKIKLESAGNERRK